MRRGCASAPAAMLVVAFVLASILARPQADGTSAPDSGQSAPAQNASEGARGESNYSGRADIRVDPPSVRTAADIPRPRWSADEPVYRVSKVVDGDTLRLSDGEKVRLIGVDTPETVHPQKPVEYFGREASAFTKREMDGRQVRMTFGYERRDRYGRTLGYVWRYPDDFFINAEIISQGYGFAYTKYPFEYMEEFRALERAAREEGRGLWADEEKIGEPAR
ncbi:MAG: thermonuclease family protein [bacterium]